MSEIISFPVDIVEITLPCKQKITSTLLLPTVMRVRDDSWSLAGSFANAVEKELIEEGNYLDLMRHLSTKKIEKKAVYISLEEKKNNFRYPKLTLGFDYFYTSVWNNYFVGFVPALGIESFGKDLRELEDNLRENIKLEFARKKRLKNVNLIVETQWFEELEVHKEDIELNFYTLYELENLQMHKKEKLFSKIATKMFVVQQENFGREAEWNLLKKAFLAHFQKSILLVAPKGSGKTALIREIVRQKSSLGIDHDFWETNASVMIQKLTSDSGWQENLHKISREIQGQKVILFVHSISELFDVGKYVGNSISIAEYLREYLQRGEMQIIAECTEEELSNIETRAPGYSTLFTIVRFGELSSDELKNIIVSKVNVMTRQSGITVDENAILEIIRLQKRYTPYSGFPGKTIRFIESIILNRDEEENEIKRDTILKCFCEETGMPLFLINPEINFPIEKTKNFFQRNVFGQFSAVNTVVDLLSIIKAFLTRENKPMASLLFIGPTGVGKTEMTKVLAEFIFGNRTKVTRFDMSEYADLYSVMRLTGEINAKEGLLTAAVRQNPFSVILFDELEKAHYSFYDLLLQILGEGRLTDAKGKVADFCSSIIIMTSNIGSKNFNKGRAGFENEDTSISNEEYFSHEVQKYFRPELFNRMDQIVAFSSLDKKTVKNILYREIDKIKKRQGIFSRHIELNIEEEVYDFLAKEGYDPKYGARELQRALRDFFVIPLAKKMNAYANEIPIIANLKVEGSLKVNVERSNEKLRVLETLHGSKETLNSLLEQIVEQRRYSQKLKESHHYSNLKNQYEILERKKKKKEFWKNENAFHEHKKISDILKNSNCILDEISTLEIDVSMAYLEAKKLPENVIICVKEWQEKYLQLKVKLHAIQKNEDNNVLVGIYGDKTFLLRMKDIYEQIAKKYAKSITIKTLWFRADFYAKSQKISDSSCKSDLDNFHLYVKQLNLDQEINYFHNPYIKIPFSFDLVPLQARDKLIGIEMQIEGDCSYLVFEQELGVHCWIRGERQYKYFIEISNSNFQKHYTRDTVHRQLIFKDKKIRRTYAGNSFEDTIYNIKEYNDDYGKIISEYLRNNFEKTLDRLIYGNKE